MELKYKFHNGSGVIENDTIFLQYALRKESYPLKEVVGLYRYKSFGMDTLVVASGLPGGKIKSELILLGRENVPEAFIDELVAQAPKSANLLHLPKKEAFKKMGIAGKMRYSMIAVFILTFLIICGYFSPQIYHGIMDRHLVPVSVEDMYAGNSLSSNFVSVNAHLPTSPLIVSYTKWWSSSRPFFERRKKGFYPIVPGDWKQGDPIRMVLMVDGGFELKNIALHEDKDITVQGIVRNVLWERFFWSGSMENLSRHAKSPVEHPIVIEYNTRPVYEMVWYLGGTLFFIILFLSIAGLRSRNTNGR